MAEKRRKAGLCPSCGTVETHEVFLGGALRVPQTIPHKSNKGKCLECKFMGQARLELNEPYPKSNTEEVPVAAGASATPTLATLQKLVGELAAAGNGEGTTDAVAIEVVTQGLIGARCSTAIFCLNTLAKLARKSRENKRQITFDGGILDAIISAMTIHRTRSKVQMRACELLRALSWEPDNVLQIAGSGGFEALLEAMSAHTEDDDLHIMALVVLKMLSHCLSSLPQSTMTMDSTRAFSAVRDVMEKHTGNPEVQSNGRDVLAALSEIVGREKPEAAPGAHRLADDDKYKAMIAMINREKVLAAVKATTTPTPATLRNLVDKMAAAGIDEGTMDVATIDVVTKGLIGAKGSMSFDVTIFYLTTMGDLASKHREYRRKITFDGGTLDAIMSAMTIHRTRLRVQTRACELLRTLSWEEPFNALHIASSGGCKVLLEAVTTHMDDGELHMTALAALKELSSCLSNRPKSTTLIDLAKTFALVWHLMEKHPDYYGVQLYGRKILASLSAMERRERQEANFDALDQTSTKNERKSTPGAHHLADDGEYVTCEALLEAVSAHAEDEELQRTALKALSHYLSSLPQSTTLIDPAKTFAVVWDVMKKHAGDPVFQSSGSEVLAALSEIARREKPAAVPGAHRVKDDGEYLSILDKKLRQESLSRGEGRPPSPPETPGPTETSGSEAVADPSPEPPDEAGLPFRPGECEGKELRRKRAEEGLCPKCGEVRTHKKHSGRMVPETVPGLIHEGTCLACSKELAYGLGWERAIGTTDLKLRWRRSGEKGLPKSSDCLHFAYFRKVEYLRADDEGMCPGRVSFATYDEGVVDSVVEHAEGHAIVSFSDIERAQRLNLKDKTDWFRESCSKLCASDGGRGRIIVRRKQLLEDSINAVMSFSQTDLRNKWSLELEREIGELTLDEWYTLVLDQVFCSDAGLWQRWTMDETRVVINFLSETACPAHLKYFRFVGRVLGKALFDRQLVRYRMARHLFKLLLGWPITFDDLKYMDLQYHSFLKSLDEMGANVATLGLHFTVSEDRWGLQTRVPLIPNGFEIAVDEQNLPKYIDSCFQYHMFGRCKAQLNELILGFFDVVPEPLLAVFDFQEFESLMCGSFTGGKTEEEEMHDGSRETPSNKEEAEQLEQSTATDYWRMVQHESLMEGEPGNLASADVPKEAQPGYLDAVFPDDHESTARVDQFDVRLQAKLAAGDAAQNQRMRDTQPSRLESEGNQVSPSENLDPPPNPTVLAHHDPEVSGAPIPPPRAVLPNNDGSESNSVRSLAPLEATLVEDEPPVYHAVQVDYQEAVSAKERSRRIKLGQCPTCGLQTHRISGKIFKKHNPLTNEHVYSGRCLMCNPMKSTTGSEAVGYANAALRAGTANLEINEPIEQERRPPEQAEPQRLNENMLAAVDNGSEQENEVADEEGVTFKSSSESEPKQAESKPTPVAIHESTSEQDEQEDSGHSGNYLEEDRDIGISNDDIVQDHRVRTLVESVSEQEEKMRGTLVRPSITGYDLTPSIEPYARTPSIEPAGANVATFLTTDTNTKAVRCGHCRANLFMPEDGASFLCGTCNIVTFDLDDLSGNKKESDADQVGSLKSPPEQKSRGQDPPPATQGSNSSSTAQDFYNYGNHQRALSPPPATQDPHKHGNGQHASSSKNESANVKDVDDENSIKPILNKTSEPACTKEENAKENLSFDQETNDENMDIIGQLVNMAATNFSLQFVPSSENVLPCDLHLKGGTNPSGLTLDSYFLRDLRDDRLSTAVSISEDPSEMANDKVKEFDDTRLLLNSVMECMEPGPIQLPPAYVNMIKTKTILGSGYFGEVRLGIDEPFGKRFAIKLIKPLVIEQALADRLESIQNSFRNEVKILSQLKHSNIAPLYGYCMGEGSGLRNTCLLYELAINSSLDGFWENETSSHELERARLSDGRTRGRIALEVATVLRFMHEGLDGGAKCFHRDIKSANVCLMADFSARVIDCGLAKCVTEEPGTFSTAGPTGTPGYTCPEYLGGEISFCSACDVFSFGVMLCELITGKTSCKKSQHYAVYKKKCKSGKRLETDADPFVDWGSGSLLKKMTKLALKCLRPYSEKRPSIGRVVKELALIVDNRDARERVQDLVIEDDEDQRKCRLCGRVSKKCIQCSGGSEQHVHCHNCVENALKRSINRFRYGGLACLKDGCEARRYQDDEVSGLVSQNVWDSYLNQKNSNLFQSMGRNLMNQSEANFQQIQDLLVQLSAGNGLPCPRLFILVGTDRNRKVWRNPKEWAENAGNVRMCLYFVCSHSLQLVTDNSRIKIRYSRGWLKAIAPALNESLEIMKRSMNALSGREAPLDAAKIRETDEWVKGLLEPGGGDGVEKSSSFSLSYVGEKAASVNSNWQSELVPVFDYQKKMPTFVMKKHASDYRYQRKTSSIFT